MFALILNIGSVFASNSDQAAWPKALKSISSQVYNLLGENLIPDDIRGSKAEIRIAVDNGNYLRILSIDTENASLERFIIASIDFQKLPMGSTFEKGIVYRIPIEVSN